jgi:hypothetical protein
MAVLDEEERVYWAWHRSGRLNPHPPFAGFYDAYLNPGFYDANLNHYNIV